jgi:chemotaxis protein methyltransferase CheR
MSASVKFSENDFLQYSRYLKEEIGFNVKGDKVGLLEGRLQKRLQEKNISPMAYLKLVQSDSEEKSYFFDAITTHKTDWFRENIHYEFVSNYVKTTPQSSYSFWSAASSTGEEAYSLAIQLMEDGLDTSKYKILGTDVSDDCIETCKNGIYRRELVTSQVSPFLVKKYFLQNKSERLKKYLKIDHEQINNVKFKCFNLVSSHLDTNIKFDIILLRNVMIYFDHNTINQVIQNLLRYLKDGGYLIIGLSESIHSAKELHLNRVSNSVYKYERI